MFSPDTHRHSFGALLAGQLRSVRFALLREALIGGVALTAVCLFTLMMALRYDEQLDLEPVLLQPTLFFAMLAPFAVWKGDPPFGQAYLWTQPVRRQEAAVAKMLAGAVWLMAAMLVTLVSLSVVAYLSGGRVGVHEVRLLDTGTGLAGAAHVAWTTPAWMWLPPFGSALILYFGFSAALLGLRHPFRWLGGVAVALPILAILMRALGPADEVEGALQQFGNAMWGGAFGMDFVLNGGETSLAEAVGRGRDPQLLWSALPEPGRWAMATFVWLSAAALAVALALRRHWER
jgi:hypothetical protein